MSVTHGNKASFFVRFALLSLTFLSTTAPAVDLPNFYRATLFQGEAKRDVRDWTTHLDVRYVEGSTDESWNKEEQKTLLFNEHCAFDLRKLAANLENLDTKPLTQAYALGPIPQLYDGKLAFGAHFDLEELDVTFQQNLFSGLYLQGYFPFRRLEICNFEHCKSVTTDAEHVQLLNFVNNDLDAILEENGICPLKTGTKKSDLADCMVSLGWHGNCKVKESMVTHLRGYLQAGVVIPTARRQDVDKVFSVPFGYNKHWGVQARGNVHATLWDTLVIGANAGVTIFFEQTYDNRITTSPCQNGYIMLEKACATVDPGTIWDITGYIKAERLVGGLTVLAGYSFTQRERTWLTLRDDCCLKTACQRDPAIKSRNEVINANNRLLEWSQHVLHAYAQYDFKAHMDVLFAPTIQVSYHLPLLGKYTWHTEMFGGSISLAFNWAF